MSVEAVTTKDLRYVNNEAAFFRRSWGHNTELRKLIMS